MTVEVEHKHGSFVILNTDLDQFERVVIGIRITPGMDVLYEVALGFEQSVHFGCELTTVKKDTKKVGF